MNVLVINAGSSSLKYQLLDMPNGTLLAKGLCERIGIGGHMKHQPQVGDKPVFNEDLNLPTHSEAIAAVLDKLISPEYGVISSAEEIDAIGHRVVHGGEAFASSVLITDDVMQALEDCIPLAPLHNPANITGINACTEIFKGVPQVGVFDTAFHQTMPPKAYIYALPYEYYEKDKVRRYGFHGTSHFYVSRRTAAILGKPVEELKIVTCHLGNGSSVAAIDGGKSVDTSMGFTPLDGLPMGTRSGGIDPGILQFLMERYNMTIDEMLDVLNKKSGVLGISGISSDFRDIDDAVLEGNKRADLALRSFDYNVTKLIGGYAAAMGGIDALVFTAGVGENSPEVREIVCETLGFLGLKLDKEKNTVRGKESFISTDDSPNPILVVPTNEEFVIASDTSNIVSKMK